VQHCPKKNEKMKQTILTIILTLTGMATTLYGQTVLNSDTTSTSKPIIGVQFGILIPAIGALPFSTTARVEEVSSTPDKIHTIVEVSVPKVHYIIGLLIKYKKHMALAGVIFRPHFSINEGLIEVHPNKYKIYNLKEYTWGGYMLSMDINFLIKKTSKITFCRACFIIPTQLMNTITLTGVWKGL